jgi:hypothetical protein
VKNEVKQFPIWKCFDAMYGSVKWVPNMGTEMQGVRGENSPIVDQFVYPQLMTTSPNMNVIEAGESVELGRLRWHRFESKQFNFRPTWQDFRENQLEFAHKDIIRQISLYNEKFIRGMLWNRAPNVMIAGNSGAIQEYPDALVQNVPQAETSATQTGSYKTPAWFIGIAAAVGGSLTLRTLYNALNIVDDDLNAPPFEGVLNQPRDNELIKGKYVLVTSTEAYRNFTFDPDVTNLKSINLDLLFDNFKGSLFGQITCKAERFPLRFKSDGTLVSPQIQQVDGNGRPYGKARPNPAYADPKVSKYEVAFLMGADVCRTIAVGAPPSEFTSKKMDAAKFYSLRWNGEVQLTDQILIFDALGRPQLNRYGEQLQLISQTAMGFLAGEINNFLPIVFERRRVS